MDALKRNCSRRPALRRASVLLQVMMFSVVFFIMITGVALYVTQMNLYTRAKWQADQTQYVAMAGLSHLFAYLQSLGNAPTLTGRTEIAPGPSGHRVDLPAGAGYQLYLSYATGSTSGNRRYLLESEAVYYDTRTNRTVRCRAQVAASQESFAKWEQFVNSAPVWNSPYLLEFQDFGTIGLGPIHANSGANIFSGCLFAKPVTSSAPGTRSYSNLWNMYYWVRDHASTANNYVHIAGPQADMGYPYQTVFYGGLSVNEPAVTIPGIGNGAENRTRPLRENAQIKLPADDSGAAAPNASAYPQGTSGKYMYVLEFGDPSPTNSDGQVTVKQYLGWKSTSPTSPDYKVANYRTVGTYNLNPDGQGILVAGDIVGLWGTIDGKATIAAIRNTTTNSGGDVYVTGQLQYESRVANSGFQFPDRNQLASGGQLNETYYNTLESQVHNLNDILGIAADGSVLIPEGAETGGACAARTNSYTGGDPVYGNFKSGTVANLAANGNPSSPSTVPTGTNRFFVDGIVMSTGYNGSANTFSAINPFYRKHGWIHTLGGITSLVRGEWNLFTGSSWTGGIQRYKYWDMRMSDPTLAPPFFPLTGDWAIVDNTWGLTMLGSSGGDTR